jgi:hypothetical protein
MTNTANHLYLPLTLSLKINRKFWNLTHVLREDQIIPPASSRVERRYIASIYYKQPSSFNWHDASWLLLTPAFPRGKRVDWFLGRGTRLQHQLQCTPGLVEADGSIRIYALQAHPGHYSFFEFLYWQQRHVTRENRSATAQDSPY